MNELRFAFEEMLGLHGCDVIVFKHYGSGGQSEQKVRALQNTRTERGGGDIFQFAQRVDVAPGDVIQVQCSRDLWRVTDSQDFMDGNTFVNFDVSVERARY